MPPAFHWSPSCAAGSGVPDWLPLFLHAALVCVLTALLLHAAAAALASLSSRSGYRHPDESFAALVLPSGLGLLLGGLSAAVVCCHLRDAVADTLRNPVHLALSVAATLLVARAVWRTAAHVRRARSLEARVALVGRPPGPRTVDLMERMGYRLPLVEVETAMPSLSLGRLRPWVAVSRRLVSEASDAELEAVLWHEASHAHHRDNLRGVAAAFALAVLGDLPTARALHRRWREASELRSDDVAVERTGSGLDLAAALVKEARLRRVVPSPAVSSFSASGVRERVRRLLAGPRPLPRRATAALLLLGLVAAGVGLGVLRSGDQSFSMHCVAAGATTSCACGGDDTRGPMHTTSDRKFPRTPAGTSARPVQARPILSGTVGGVR